MKSLSRSIIDECRTILSEEKFMILDKNSKNVISGDTKNSSVIVKSTDPNDNTPMTKEEVDKSIKDAKDNLPDDSDDIANSLDKELANI